MKKIYTTLVTTLLLTISITTFGMEPLPWYKKYIKNLEGELYLPHCLIISIIQAVRGGSLLSYYLVTHDKNNSTKHIHMIEQELQKYEYHLLEQEQKALIAIKQKFNVPNDVWNECIATINRLKKINHQAMKKARPDSMHDKELPKELLQFVTSLLQSNDINPQAITLVCSKEQPPNSPGTLAQAYGRVAFFKDVKLHFDKNYRTQQITFFPKILRHSLNEQKAVCAHEIQHLIQQHAITTLVLGIAINHYCNVRNKKITESKEYQWLLKIHEAQAEILPSIKDPEIASGMTKLRALSYYPEYLYEDHFYDLSTIYMLWKIHAWLTYFNENN